MTLKVLELLVSDKNNTAQQFDQPGFQKYLELLQLISENVDIHYLIGYYSPTATGLSALDHSLHEPTYRLGTSMPACSIANKL